MDAVSQNAADVDIRDGGMDLNLVVLCGRLATESVIRKFDTGATQLRMLVAVETPIPSPRLDLLPVIYWKPPAGLLNGSLNADTRVWISGAVRRRFTESGPSSGLEVVGASMSIRRPDSELIHV